MQEKKHFLIEEHKKTASKDLKISKATIALNNKIKKHFDQNSNCALSLKTFENLKQLENEIAINKNKIFFLQINKLFYKLPEDDWKKYSFNSVSIYSKIKKPITLGVLKILLIIQKIKFFKKL